MSLDFILKHNIGFDLDWGEHTTFAAIAETTGLHEDNVRRMLRLAMCDHLFRELESDVLVHSPTGWLLFRDDKLRAWMRVTVDGNWPPMLKIAVAMSRYPGSEEPLESVYCLAHGIKEPPFAVWDRDPARNKKFADAMSFMHLDFGFQRSDVLVYLDRESTCTFVDVGGSQGHVSISLARSCLRMKSIVQDMPETIVVGRAQRNRTRNAQIGPWTL